MLVLSQNRVPSDEEYANTPMDLSSKPSSTGTNTTGVVTDKLDSVTGMATGAAKMAYGHATGDTATVEAGKQDWVGTNK